MVFLSRFACGGRELAVAMPCLSCDGKNMPPLLSPLCSPPLHYSPWLSRIFLRSQLEAGRAGVTLPSLSSPKLRSFHRCLLFVQRNRVLCLGIWKLPFGLDLGLQVLILMACFIFLPERSGLFLFDLQEVAWAPSSLGAERSRWAC